MTNDLRKLLGKAACGSIEETHRRAVRRILAKDRKLSTWYKTPGGLLLKFRRLCEFLQYRMSVTKKLTRKDMNAIRGQRAGMYDVVDFIRNRKSPFILR